MSDNMIYSIRNKKIAAVVVIILLLLIYMLLPVIFPATQKVYSQREAHLSAYSDSWDGLSDFRRALEHKDYNVSSIISNPLVLREVKHPENTLYICAGVERGYDSIEVDEFRNFVNMGGKVLVMDDYGKANTLSEKLGVTFTHHRVWSQDYVHNLSFIKIEARVDFEHYTVLLDEPTTLKKELYTDPMFREPQVILTTSKDSYEDTNDNGHIDSIGNKDHYGMLPVGMAVESKGKEGKMVFISDSSLCINDMWGRFDNANYTLALVKWLIGPEGRIIFDESRHVQASPVENSVYGLENIYFYILLEHNPILALIIALIFLNTFGLIYLLTKNPERFRHRFDLTYEDAFVEHAPDRVNEVRTILLTRLKSHYNLYFPDASMTRAYDASTKQEYDLTKRSHLQVLINDPEIVDFLLRPARYSIPERLNTIVMKIDAAFPIDEMVY